MANQRRQQINLNEIDFRKFAKKWVIRALVIFVVGTILIYFLDPALLNGLFFSFLIEGLPYLILGVFFLFSVFKGMLATSQEKKTKGYMWFFIAGSTFIFGSILFTKVLNYCLYQQLAKDVKEIESYIPINKDVLRFTPRIVAYNQMETTVRARTETVEWSHCRPYLNEQSFGYVAPITPDGLRPKYFKKNPGFVKYEDNYEAENVITRIDQPFEVGEEMEYTDNIFRKLYFDDFFAQYPKIHYMSLGDEGKFYAIAPKIKYKYVFPFFFIPYWSGTAIIDDQGTIETVSREVCANSERFKGKWMAPLALFKQYVQVQDYAVGFWNTFTSVDGMLSVPDLPNNDYPLVIFTKDNETYLVIDTEPQGTGRGLYRVYYQNAQTGEIFMYQPPNTEPIIGPRGAMSKVYSLKGYHWYSSKGEGSSGNMLALEPVYLTQNIDGKEVLYWKFSITSLDRTRVSATVVVEATEGGDMFEFTERKDYEKWLHNEAVQETTVSTDSTSVSTINTNNNQLNQRIELLESHLEAALKELNQIKQMQRDSI